MTKQQTLIHRITPELKAKAQEKAKSEGRSLSNWIKWLITREVR